MSRPFYIIAHRANDVQSVARALDRGANAVECDVSHRDNTFFVRHPPVVGVSLPVVERDTNWDRPLVPYLNAVSALARTDNRLVMVIFDCKMNDPALAVPLLNTIRSRLTNGVLDLNVLISVGSYSDRRFFTPLAGQLCLHEGVAIDEDNNPARVSAFFRSLAVERHAYGNGTFVAGVAPNVPPSIIEAVAHKALGRGIRFVYVWTLNDKRSIRNYLRMGVDGIFVNDVRKLAEIVGEPEFSSKVRLARRGDDPFAPSTVNAYVLTVETGTRRHAGTDANLSFRLIGDSGTVATTISAKPPGLFERGQTNLVTLYGPNVGMLQSLIVGRDTAGNGPGWYLNAVTVESTRLSQGHRLRFETWIPRRGARRWVAHAQYRLEVKTSDIWRAGTDATVTFSLQGTGLRPGAPTTIRQEFDGSVGSRFERRRLNAMTMEGPNIGRIQSLTVSHDGSGLGDDWHLQWVRVRGPDETKRFDFNQWIYKNRPVTRR
jgi:glycerophosphoryl diester phosphodiesterase